MAVRVTMTSMTVNLVIYFLVVSRIFWSIDASKDITYSLHNVPSSQLDTVIELDHSYRYRRQANGVNDTHNATDSTAIPPAPATTTKKPATQAPTTKRQPQRTQPPTPRTTTPTTNILEGKHKYYNSLMLQNSVDTYWDELVDAEQHDSLKSHRTAVSMPVSFTFPFYGHNITKITIATGGFLYTSPFLHQWLTATQYIAPLMGNFDISIGNESDVYYKDYGTKFVVEWRNVQLQDQNATGQFQFQTIIHINGSIVFSYKKIPVPIVNISTTNHPVKIGVSDAFYIDSVIVDPETEESYKRRTIYEYHRVSLGMQQIHPGTVVLLHPLPTCNVITDCNACVNDGYEINCSWCSKVGRCSDGIDWHRQEWVKEGCIDSSNSNNCPSGGSSASTIGAVVAVVIILVALVTGVVVWFVYAYKNPTSSSGIWLIEHRPSQMKNKMANMKFWKRNTPSGEKYQVEAEA